MEVTASSGSALVERVGSVLAEDATISVVAVIPAGLDPEETLALCSTLAAMGVAGIEGADATVIRRCLDTAKALRAGDIDAIGSEG